MSGREDAYYVGNLARRVMARDGRRPRRVTVSRPNRAETPRRVFSSYTINNNQAQQQS